MDLLEKLNESQKEAVLHTEGPLLILAGAGSGKTRVITHRIAHLIKNLRIPPYRIFSVTFTNKAAGEMKHRIGSLAGSEGNSVFTKTFHSAAVYILRRWGKAISIDSNFSIYDTSDQAALVKEILTDMNIDVKKVKPASIASQISEIKDKRDFIEGMPVESFLHKTQFVNFADLFKTYQDRMRRLNALDFNDLLLKTVDLMRSTEEPLAEMQRLWRYFMVDEYQDTNYAQYLITKYVSAASKNICVVGDDDQSIYSWRGADIRNILEFEKDFSNAKIITLNKNYRSTPRILDAAYAVIKNNHNRKPKDVTADREDGEPIEWHRAGSEYDEARYVVDKIVSLKHSEGYTNESFAIFYRTNAQSRVFEEFLRREGIAYRIVGGLKFYDRKEIKDIIGYLRLIVNSNDLISLLRVINNPHRGVGTSSIEKLREAAAAHGVSEWRAISESLIPGKPNKGIAEFKSIIENAMMMCSSVPSQVALSEFVKSVIDSSGYRKSLEEEKSIENTQRLENIDEFLNSVYEYEEDHPEATLYQFLQDVSLLTSAEDPAEVSPAGAVTLMTVHNAKGLEYTSVFLTGMEEDIFPHRFSIDTEEGIEEERRLCYVGITRAKERLFLTCAEQRRTFTDVFMKQPSRFIYEIPEEMIVFSSHDSLGQDDYRPGKRSFGSAEDYRQDVKVSPVKIITPAVQKDNIISLPQASASSSGFARFDNIAHPKYGAGKIIKIEGTGDNTKITIQFKSGVKTFLEKYTPLEKLH